MEEKNNLILDVNQRPNIVKWIVLAIQHVFAMFGATILVPILVNSQAGEEVLTIPVALVASGIGTLIYIICTKGKSPVYLGSSFAFITPIVAAYAKGGMSGAMTGIMVVGLIYVVFAIIVKIIGKRWIDKLLPPVVIGPMIMIIGLSLAPSAIGQIGLSAGGVIEWQQVVVALVSFLVTAVVAVAAKGFLKIIPFLVGIVSGYLTAVAVGIVDFSPLAEAAMIGVPNFVIPYLHYTPDFISVLTIAPIALVTMAEHIGDHAALSAIIDRDLLKEPGLSRTLLGDGLATFVSALIGGPANTTYGENTSVVGMTKVASVWVIGLAAILAIALGFFSKFTALVSTIPNAVLGGVSLLLYGFIAVNGLKVLIQNRVDFNNTKNVIVASAMLVLGLGGATISIVSGDISVTISGMSLAAIVGIILNLFLPNEKKNIKLESKEERKDEKEKVKLVEEEIKIEEDIIDKIFESEPEENGTIKMELENEAEENIATKLESKIREFDTKMEEAKDKIQSPKTSVKGTRTKKSETEEVKAKTTRARKTETEKAEAKTTRTKKTETTKTSTKSTGTKKAETAKASTESSSTKKKESAKSKAKTSKTKEEETPKTETKRGRRKKETVEAGATSSEK